MAFGNMNGLSGNRAMKGGQKCSACGMTKIKDEYGDTKCQNTNCGEYY